MMPKLDFSVMLINTFIIDDEYEFLCNLRT